MSKVIKLLSIVLLFGAVGSSAVTVSQIENRAQQMLNRLEGLSRYIGVSSEDFNKFTGLVKQQTEGPEGFYAKLEHHSNVLEQCKSQSDKTLRRSCMQAEFKRFENEEFHPFVVKFQSHEHYGRIYASLKELVEFVEKEAGVRFEDRGRFEKGIWQKNEAVFEKRGGEWIELSEKQNQHVEPAQKVANHSTAEKQDVQPVDVLKEEKSKAFFESMRANPGKIVVGAVIVAACAWGMHKLWKSELIQKNKFIRKHKKKIIGVSLATSVVVGFILKNYVV